MHGFYSQKEIYRSGKVTGAVRILKGQEILPDDSTLVQHNISDGDTVNIVIEPEKQITVEVVCNLGTFKLKISNSLLVKGLKKKLIDSKLVTFLPREFNFETELSEHVTTILDDDSLPLHEYGIRYDCQLLVVKLYLFLTLLSQDRSRKLYKKVSKKTTVGQLKTIIIQYFCVEKDIDISMYISRDQIEFMKVNSKPDALVGEVLSDGQTVCYLKEMCDYSTCWPVMSGNIEVGRVYGDSQDTVGTVKLRIQDQLGIPASCIKVTKTGLDLYKSRKYHRAPTTDNEKMTNLQFTVHVNDSFSLFDSKLLGNRPYLFLTLLNEVQSRKVYKRVSKKTTVKELTKMIIQLFCDEEVIDISLFVTSDQTQFVKLDPVVDITVDEILSDGQIICYLEDLSDYSTCWPVKRDNKDIGYVYGNKKDPEEVIKLRVQDQLGISTSCLKVSGMKDKDLGSIFTITVTWM